MTGFDAVFGGDLPGRRLRGGGVGGATGRELSPPDAELSVFVGTFTTRHVAMIRYINIRQKSDA